MQPERSGVECLACIRSRKVGMNLLFPSLTKIPHVKESSQSREELAAVDAVIMLVSQGFRYKQILYA